MSGEFAGRSKQKKFYTVQLSYQNGHACHICNINTISKAFHCPSDQFIKNTTSLVQHLTTWKDTVIHVFPKQSISTAKHTLWRARPLRYSCTVVQNVPKNLAFLDFESISVQEDKFLGIATPTWMGKHVPISISSSCSLMPELNFPRNSYPCDLVESFVEAAAGLATQTEEPTKKEFMVIETNVEEHFQIKIVPQLIKIGVASNQYRNLKTSLSIKWSKMHRNSFYKHTVINVIICWVASKGIATLFLYLVSKALNTKLFQYYVLCCLSWCMNERLSQ